MFSLINILFGDAAVAYQLGFQDPATTTMEGIYLFNLHLLFVIISIVIVVGWLLFSVLTNFTEFDNSNVADFTHFNPVEIIWITIPAFILLGLTSSSFSLLYSLDEISNPELTLKTFGHQWYSSYEISDFNSCSTSNQSLKYSSYMLQSQGLRDNINSLNCE
jgi:heme/copper-type cytochrome/quinol oxidase subunit 2